MNGNIKIINLKKNKFGESLGDIVVKSSNLKPINFPKKELLSTIDELPIIFIIASQINGISTFNNIEVLRGKESDRIKKISENLKACGIKTYSTKDSLKIYGNPKIKPKRQIKISASLDHRIAMSFQIFALVTGYNILIRGFETVNTSFPRFLKICKKLNCKYEIKKN